MEQEELKKLIDERVRKLMPEILKGSAFTDRKITDTPTEDLMIVNRKYTNLNGTVANRPTSSVATVGQRYFATDTNIPMTYSTTGWRNGVGSVVAAA